MKYLLVGLMLLLAPMLRPSPAPQGRPDAHLDAWFEVAGANGRMTDVDVFVDWQQGRAGVRLALDRSVPAGQTGAFSVNTVASVRPGDFVIAPDLTWATLHTTLPAYDAISRSTRDVRIDLDWSVNGGAYHVAGVDRSVVYDASAHGFVASATAVFLAGGRSDQGTIGQY